jgi:hypothetical protein
MYLYFSYPTAYIDKQFRKMLGDCISSTSIIPVIENEYKFIQLRKKLMGQPTARQSQLEAQIVQYTLDNDEYKEKPSMQIATSVSSTNPQSKKSQDNIIIHYTHEKRFISMKKDMHEIFREAFQGLGLDSIRLIVGNRNSPNSQRELIRKRPHLKLLTLKHKGNTICSQISLFEVL